MFSCLPSIPYGFMADRYGRKIVLLMALSGIFLGLCWNSTVGYFHDTFNIRWIWAGNAFLLLGGGSTVARSMFFTIVADVTPEDKRYKIFLNMFPLLLWQ